MEFKHSSFRLIMPLIFTVLLSACSANKSAEKTVPKVQPLNAPEVLTEIDNPAQFYLTQAELPAHPQAINWQLLAARALVAEGNSARALKVLQNTAKQVLSPQQKFEFNLVKAEAYFFEKRYLEASSVLATTPNLATSMQAHWQRYYLLKATIAELLGQDIAAAESRLQLNAFLSSELVASNNNKLWQLLRSQSVANLHAASNDYFIPQPVLSGWLQLAAIAIEFGLEPQLLISNLQAWKNNNPEHPAFNSLPEELIKAMATTPYAPNQIAILAPLTGKRGATGRAIRDGMISAYYQEKESERLNLRFYDTAKSSADTLYQQAIEEGADFVVGPLLKSNLELVLPLVTGTPLLSLNKLEENPVNENIYYFSLTSNDEAIAAAKRMHQDGIQHPLVLAPSSKIGERLAAVFTTQWQTMTEEESEVYQYSSRADLQNTVAKLFAVDDSQQRIKLMKSLIGNDIKAKSRSRRDIDAIYLITKPSEAMLAIPYISTTQNPYTKQVALYASSRTHQDTLPEEQSKDLNGLIFSDMPWLLNPDRKLKQQTLALWPNMSKIEQNLFAMGYDTFKLIPNLLQLRNFPSLRLQGQTGILYVNAMGNIERGFSWAKYNSGKITLEAAQTPTQSESSER